MYVMLPFSFQILTPLPHNAYDSKFLEAKIDGAAPSIAEVFDGAAPRTAEVLVLAGEERRLWAMAGAKGLACLLPPHGVS